ncbi:hypothetical protein AUI06_01360 [archaeon 13_2_20CM_2_52_21]|nr:MAG: hypothetical protein AUI06_01360 [archaeon 13_2_20CM_2_52_21]OLD08825.1 MAG: hypothetical protein AUI95_02260 [Crenarchaeota archaeon 13_1_40CM_3_52_4]
MFDDLVDYVRENYSRASKIVELGVGGRIEVAEKIKKNLPMAEVLVTDKDLAWVRKHVTGRVRAVADDVMFPQTPIYQNASLLYSIHPPFEILAPMADLAGKIGADLLVVPRSDEQEMFHDGWQKLVRNGRTLGWLRTSRKNAVS